MVNLTIYSLTVSDLRRVDRHLRYPENCEALPLRRRMADRSTSGSCNAAWLLPSAGQGQAGKTVVLKPRQCIIKRRQAYDKVRKTT